MSNVILCQGNYADSPYFAKDDCKNIYCIEELCFYLYHNAFLLDDGFVDEDLAVWIDEELGLESLAQTVHRLCGKNNALNRLIEALAESVGYYTEDEWKDLLRDVGANNSMSVEERRKCRADGFMEAGRFGLALNEYEVIIRQSKITEIKLRAKVYHNMGVCAARLFMFEQAAGFFEKAYDTYANTESFVEMLAAMKLYMSEAQYLEYLSSHKETYEDSLEVEGRFDRIRENYKETPTALYMRELSEKKQHGKAYYEGIDSLTEEVKDEYRDRISRGRTGGF